jgi:acyl-CoA dehydrogenase
VREIFREDHEAMREQARRFLAKEVVPHHSKWERQGFVPKDIWRAAGRNGLLCISIPAEYGGGGGDLGHSTVIIEEMARANVSAPGFTTHSEIVARYILAYGTEAQKHKWLPLMAAGECIAVIAMTEPGAGSDLRSIRTTARPDDDHYVINGQKTFITNGGNADLTVTVAKTNPSSKELTLICVENDRSGFTKGPLLEKIGLRGQDTCELFYSDVRVPVANRLGEENKGFKYLSHQLAWERLIIAIRAAASIEAMLEETILYTRDRQIFGKSVFDHQNTRFTLAEAKARARMLRVFVDHCIKLVMRDELTAVEAAMAKLVGSELQNQLLDDFLQFHGGNGYMAGYNVGRAWVDARISRIYGGANEVMKEIIARSL